MGRSTLCIAVALWMTLPAGARTAPSQPATDLSSSTTSRLALHRYEAVEPHMGTLAKITLYAAGEAEARRAFRAAFGRIRELDDVLSDYKVDSELNQAVSAAARRATPISRDLFAVLACAQDLAEASGGAFDVTQGALTRVWREARRSGRVPDPLVLRTAAANGGFRKLHLDRTRQALIVEAEGMALDVGALGKGYAASEALAVLTSSGVRSALVAISGDLAFSDAPPGAAGWRIALHDEADAGPGPPRVVELVNAAVSTAGASEQHLDAAGLRYSHIIDPHTGVGVTEDLTVTVIATHGLEADGLDTAVSVLGVERGLALVDSRPSAAALIVRRTPAGITLLPSLRLAAFVSQPRTPR